MKKHLILTILLLTSLAAAAGLDGRTVILLVSEHRSGDPRAEPVREKLLAVREQLGYTKDEMPIYIMGFEDSDTERRYFDRLGFQAFDSPVLAVVEWGNPARFGPKRVIDYAIARSATPQHVDYIVQKYLEIEGRTSTPIAAPSPVPSPPPKTPGNDNSPGAIQIANVRFEAAGKPLYMTNVGIRLQNVDDHTLKDIRIRFYSKLKQEDQWRFMGEKELAKLPTGYFASRDIVGDTKEYGLVDTEGNAIRCFYRIEIEHAGRVITEEGEFIPSESPLGSTDPLPLLAQKPQYEQTAGTINL